MMFLFPFSGCLRLPSRGPVLHLHPYEAYAPHKFINSGEGKLRRVDIHPPAWASTSSPNGLKIEPGGDQSPLFGGRACKLSASVCRLCPSSVLADLLREDT